MTSSVASIASANAEAACRMWSYVQTVRPPALPRFVASLRDVQPACIVLC